MNNPADEIWPYLIFLPAEPENLKRFLTEVLGSPISIDILEKIKEGTVCQKDIIRRLAYSNKTTLAHLKNLVEFNVVKEDFQIEGGRRIICYKPTSMGRWILLMFERKLSTSDLGVMLEELFSVYLNNALELCLSSGLDFSRLSTIFSRSMGEGLIKLSESSRLELPSVLVFGSVALDTFSLLEEKGELGGSRLLYELYEFPGGSGGNVAVALSRLGVNTSFIGKLGGDTAGWQLLSDFIKEGVDVSSVIIDKNKRTSRSFIVAGETGKKRTYIYATKDTALSLTNPNEISWNLMKDADIFYIGETFLEISELIAGYGKNLGKTIVYRPTIHYLIQGFKKLEGILRNTNVFIINETGWETLKEIGVKSKREVLEIGPDIFIITRGTKGCDTYTKDFSFHVDAYDVKTVDEIGAGDAFAAGLIAALLQDKGFEELKGCILFASASAALATRKLGPRSSLPSFQEVMDLINKEPKEVQEIEL
ncbi:MAG: PfkB family carbohydrate kinase [Candidatus Jordarchaeum sp.]|uniref:PfkB family carbohydrate kinase n=1 Tax=Candidatus Jordarchaeum sp. TaxID=2823881 RepID=UPI00404ADD18